MSADLLRRAAARIRERASVATPGPWRDEMMGSEGSLVRAGGETIHTARRVARTPEFADAEHIALWSPDVAELVADWLFDEAVQVERGDQFGAPHPFAVRLARRILGED